VGDWIHAHEEDAEHEMVFRPASHSFAPSRGRRALQLRSDGTYVERAPGPTDAPVTREGTWSLEADRLMLGAAGDRGPETWHVGAAEPDRLTLRR
jgi:hypothetical protein